MEASSQTLTLVTKDHIFAQLVALGINEKWLRKANPPMRDAKELLSGLLFLRDLYPNAFKDK
jgi:hypothetical protein